MYATEITWMSYEIRTLVEYVSVKRVNVEWVILVEKIVWKITYYLKTNVSQIIKIWLTTPPLYHSNQICEANMVLMCLY